MSTPTFRLFDLPEELILEVLDASEVSDLTAFIQTSHDSWRIGHPALYSSSRPIQEKQTAFLWVAENNRPKLLDFLTKDILPVIKEDTGFRDIGLLTAARAGCCEIITLLLDNGATTSMDRAFIEAVTRDKPEAVKLFIARGSSIDKFPNHEFEGHNVRLGKDNILHWAAMDGAAGVVSYLLTSNLGLNINSVDSNSVTPLMKAVQGAHAETVAVLLKHGADTEISAVWRGQPLACAAETGQNAIISQLIDAGARLNGDDPRTFFSPLLTAVRTGYYPKFRTDPEGPRAHRSYSTIQLLLSRGADPNLAKDRFQRSALHQAAAEGDVAMVRLLLEYNCNPDIPDYLGGTPLVYATEFPEVVAVLLDARASVCAPEKPGTNFPLAMAVVEKHTAAAEMLLARWPGDINGTDLLGRTALAVAAYYQHRGLVKMLIDAGADLNKRDCVGLTALDQASYRVSTERPDDVGPLLREAGAQLGKYEGPYPDRLWNMWDGMMLKHMF